MTGRSQGQQHLGNEVMSLKRSHTAQHALTQAFTQQGRGLQAVQSTRRRVVIHWRLQNQGSGLENCLKCDCTQ